MILLAALLALDAQAILIGTHGERSVPLDTFFIGPAKSVRDRELIREIRVPLTEGDWHGGFYKIGRTAEDISLINAAAMLNIQNGIIIEARLVLGAVAPIPLPVVQAEEALIGQPATEETFQSIVEIVRREVRPISDQRASADYRRRMSGIAAIRALRQAAGLAQHGEEWHHA